MKIFPAIDIINGSVVRLTKGDFADITNYRFTPLAAAHEFQGKGARYLHIIDLDGAKEGSLSNFSVIKDIIHQTGMSVQVGGGIRTIDRIERYLDAGAARVILGTGAISDREFLLQAIDRFGDRIAVGVDAKDGYVAIEGWQTVTKTKSMDFCLLLLELGIKTVIYTDIDKDGAMQGTNLEIYSELSKISGLDIIASGGVSDIAEITPLKEMGTYGCIIGKALYEGAIDLKDALAVAKR